MQLIVNITVLAAFWPFFLQIVFYMLMALLQFARLVLIRPQIDRPVTDKLEPGSGHAPT